MKLKDLLELSEETTSASVARYSQPIGSAQKRIIDPLSKLQDLDVNDGPVKPIHNSMKRIGFLKYAIGDVCKSCNIIKQFGFSEHSRSKELTCNSCGKIHKKGM